MSRWRKLRKLSWSDRAFLVLATGGLASVGALLRLAGFERTLAWLRRASRGRARRRLPEDQEIGWARDRARLISIAARFGPYRGTCLRRSLLLWWLARRKGIKSELRIGVRRDGDLLVAHAWIELDGEPLNDKREVVANFSTFDTARLPDNVSWS